MLILTITIIVIITTIPLRVPIAKRTKRIKRKIIMPTFTKITVTATRTTAVIIIMTIATGHLGIGIGSILVLINKKISI